MMTDTDKTKQELRNMINAIGAIVDILTPDQLIVVRNILDEIYTKSMSKNSKKSKSTLDVAKFETITPYNLDEIYTIRK